MRIRTDQLKEGMVLSEGIYATDSGGMPLVPRHTILTPQLIDQVISSGVKHVYIVTAIESPVHFDVKKEPPTISDTLIRSGCVGTFQSSRSRRFVNSKASAASRWTTHRSRTRVFRFPARSATRRTGCKTWRKRWRRSRRRRRQRPGHREAWRRRCTFTSIQAGSRRGKTATIPRE